MNQQVLVVALALGSALAFAVSSTLKHLSAGRVPDATRHGAGSLRRFIRATLSHPLWLGGIGADVFGLSLQVLALHFGALGVVQPLLISSMLFALLLRSRAGQGVSGRELGWAGVVTVALVGFLALAGTATMAPSRQPVDWGPAVVAAVVGLVLAVGCVVVERSQRRPNISAVLLGIAVGTIYAATAALLKALTTIALRGPVALLASWQLYTVVAVGAGGLLLNQLAFQAGPLSASLPAIATVDPIFSVALGVAVYDDPIRRGLAADIGMALLLLVLGASVIALARSAARRTSGHVR